MKILFVTAQPFTPQMAGGLQTSATEVALLLKNRGHKVAILSALMPNGYWGWRGRIIIKLLRWKAAPDWFLGFPLWRAWFPWEAVPWLAKRMKPDLVIVLARQPVRMARAAQDAGIPVLMMLQDVEFSDHGGDFATLGKVPCVANSEFTAGLYREAFGVDSIVIPPLIDGEKKYKVATTRENVTFINPHPAKGLETALKVAEACPDIPFAFIETWPLGPKERADLEEKLARLPNVELKSPVQDMRKVYGRCKILLAPSKWLEGFGRVATEAQFSGIPVVASRRGGLPEAVGQGGVLIDPEAPVDEWAAAIRRLWTDEAHYAALSVAALRNASRAALRQEAQADMWEKICMEAVKPAPKGPALRLSVIVCTRNRAHGIRDCLDAMARSILAAGNAGIEIVIVDNASTDDTPAIIAEWASLSPVAVRLFHESKPGVSAARNCGIRAARGDLLVFTDDDCRLSETHIADALRHDAADAEGMLRGGRVELGDPEDLPLTIKTSDEPARWSRALRSAKNENIANSIVGCNMSVRRAVVIQKIGFFDETLGPGNPIPASEDTDFLYRAYLAGVTLDYTPDMMLYHFHGRKTIADGRELMRNYGIGNGAIYAKYFFRHSDFYRQLYWDIKGALREIRTGEKAFLPVIGLGYREWVAWCLRGMIKYWIF